MKKKATLKAIISAAVLGTILAAPAAANPYTQQGYQYQNSTQGNIDLRQHLPANHPAVRNQNQQVFYYQQGQYQQNQPAYYPQNQPGYYPQNQPVQYYPQNTQGYNQQQQQPVYNNAPQPQQVAPAATSFGQEVLALTNQARAEHGLAPLQGHFALETAATSHSQEMLNLGYFSHTSPTPGRTDPSSRVRQAGASPNYVAENIFQASGHDTSTVAALAVQSWLESPGHRRNLLSPNATHIGIGFVEMNGTVAVTQVFGAGL